MRKKAMNEQEKMYRDLLKKLKTCIKLKGVLSSIDNGKNWFIDRQVYVSHANEEHEKYEFSEIGLEGLRLLSYAFIREQIESGFCPICEASGIANEELSLYEEKVYVCGACKLMVEDLRKMSVAKSGAKVDRENL